MRAHEIIEETGLKVELHAYGTNVEGEIDAILEAVKKVHATLHEEGTMRLTTAIKLGTRRDKEPRLADKIGPAKRA